MPDGLPGKTRAGEGRVAVEQPTAAAGPDAAAERRPDTEAVQILATEHWSLLATRSLSWNESFSRSGMFLTVLSGAVVALALIAQATGFGTEFQTFALVLLPVVLFIGVTTFVRLVAVNTDDFIWVIAMNRIRAGYLAQRPDLAAHFTTGYHDDFAGVWQTYGGLGAPMGKVAAVMGGFTTTPALVATVTSVVGGVLAGTLAARLGMGTGGGVAIGAVAFCVVIVLLLLYQARQFFAFMRTQKSRFPSPSDADAPSG